MDVSRWRLLTFAALLALAAGAQASAVLQVEQTDASKYPHLKAYVSLVNSAGAPMAGLSKENFKVYELKTNEVSPTKVDSLEASGDGLALTLVIQNSGTMLPVMDDIKKAAAGFVASLGDKDQVSVVTYSDKEEVIAPMGLPSQAAGAIGKISNPGMQKLMFDGIETAFNQFTGSGLPAARAIVVLGDGGDEGSSADAERLIAEAHKKHIPIYAIGHSETGGQALATLQDLATRATGGGYAYVEAPTAEDFNKAFSHVRDLLTKEYVVEWNADDLKGDKKVHPIDVAIEVGGTSLRGGGEIRMPYVKSYTALIITGIIVLLLAGIGALVWFKTRPQPIPVVLCPVCGQQQMPDWDVCLFCLKVAKATLKSTKGASSGKVYPLVGKTVKIGKGPENAIKLPDPAVSSNHCGVQVDGTKFEIVDLGSKNGAFVNGKRGTRRFLRNGDILSLGQSELKFESKVTDSEGGDYTGDEG